MFLYIVVLPPIVTMNSDNKNQGRYHLLAIFLIPINLMTLFLFESIGLKIGIPVISALIAYFLLKK
jgi:hypothetical protein